MKNTFNGFVPKNERLMLEAIEKHLNNKYPNRMKVKEMVVSKYKNTYELLLKNGLGELEIYIDEEELKGLSQKMIQKDEKEKVQEQLYLKALREKKR